MVFVTGKKDALLVVTLEKEPLGERVNSYARNTATKQRYVRAGNFEDTFSFTLKGRLIAASAFSFD